MPSPARLRQRGLAAREVRGELRFTLPPGYRWSEAGRIEINPDEHVAGAIWLVLRKFRKQRAPGLPVGARGCGEAARGATRPDALPVEWRLINLDFADVRAIMHGMGKAIMGTGEASGEKRANRTAEAAVANPLLNDVSMKGAHRLWLAFESLRP